MRSVPLMFLVIGTVLVLGAAVARATAPPARGGEAVPALIGASSGPLRVQAVEAKRDPYWRIAHHGVSAQLAP